MLHILFWITSLGLVQLYYYTTWVHIRNSTYKISSFHCSLQVHFKQYTDSRCYSIKMFSHIVMFWSWIKRYRNACELLANMSPYFIRKYNGCLVSPVVLRKNAGQFNTIEQSYSKNSLNRCGLQIQHKINAISDIYYHSTVINRHQQQVRVTESVSVRRRHEPLSLGVLVVFHRLLTAAMPGSRRRSTGRHVTVLFNSMAATTARGVNRNSTTVTAADWRIRFRAPAVVA